jgi:hypothetical protein
MTQSSYPPPPPPDGSAQPRFHGPGTNFFPSVRMQLASLEWSPQSRIDRRPNRGLIVAFVTAGILAILISVGIQLALSFVVGEYAMVAIIAPLSEEPAKALCMLIVVLFMWKVVPNRRYGAALGGAAGLGFGIVESVFYIITILSQNEQAWLVAVRILLTPLMHPLWSAFVGIGIFAYAASKSNSANSTNSSLWLPLLFLCIGMLNHGVWNGMTLIGELGAQLGYVAIALDALVVFPVFAFVLRDFLGGHFNFRNFYETLREPSSPYPGVLPPPPPPPPL